MTARADPTVPRPLQVLLESRAGLWLLTGSEGGPAPTCILWVPYTSVLQLECQATATTCVPVACSTGPVLSSPDGPRQQWDSVPSSLEHSVRAMSWTWGTATLHPKIPNILMLSGLEPAIMAGRFSARWAWRVLDPHQQIEHNRAMHPDLRPSFPF